MVNRARAQWGYCVRPLEGAQAGKEVGRQGDRLTSKKSLDTQWPLRDLDRGRELGTLTLSFRMAFCLLI